MKVSLYKIRRPHSLTDPTREEYEEAWDRIIGYTRTPNLTVDEWERQRSRDIRTVEWYRFNEGFRAGHKCERDWS